MLERRNLSAAPGSALKLIPSPEPEQTPTLEQEAIYDAVRSGSDNLMLNALAGTGKTHVLEEVQNIFHQMNRADPQACLYLVFNVRNRDEALDKMNSKTVCKTINGMGHSVWFGSGRTIVGKPDARKPWTILRAIINEAKKPDRDAMWDAADRVVAGVNLAKALGYVPEGSIRDVEPLCSAAILHSSLDESPDDLVADLIDQVLRISIRQAINGTIDFNDQVYMPTMFGGAFPKFPLVMVDEFQDLSPVNHAFLAKLARGRVIGVGDPWQNIYGFRGAKAAGMAEAVQFYSMREFPLSVSFRCPSEIVRHVHWHVPNFRAFRTGGSVSIPTELASADLPHDATIISRNNAPLFSMAFKLLADGSSVSVAGSDIGPRLINTLRKLGPESLTRGQALSAIANWEAEKLANESKSARDLAECMRIFCSKGSDLSQAITYAEHLFKQTGSIQLLTGHKAKGLEFEDVYHLDPYLCGDSPQDKNLRYVISTRSKDRLTEIDSSQIRWGE